MRNNEEKQCLKNNAPNYQIGKDGLEIGILGERFTEKEIMCNRERYIKEYLKGESLDEFKSLV